MAIERVTKIKQKIVKFTVEGNPVGWQRAGRNGKRSFTEAKTLRFETAIRKAYLQAAGYIGIIENPVIIDIIAYYPIPKSWSKKKKKQAIDGEIRPVVKPDIDNVLKCIDGLNCTRQHPKAAWRDDKQVVDAHIRKFYSDHPRLEVTIEIL